MTLLGHRLGSLNWALVVAVLAVVATFAVAWLQRRRKRLSCTWTATSLVAIAEHSTRLEIVYDGQRVSSASAVRLTLRHTGNDSIRPADFERPVRFLFGPKARILTCEVIVGRPPNLSPTVRLVYGTASGGAETIQAIDLEPLLLNAGDSIDLKVVVEDLAGVAVDARIAGVKRVETNVDDSEPRSLVTRLMGAFLAGSVLAILGIEAVVSDKDLRFKIENRVILLTVAAALLLLVGSSLAALRDSRRRRLHGE